ncbi:MAG: UDP-glucose--hexose-1-phosphate uridylyltransferase [Eubacterium sp.]|nr:UDP-glucose--hexose-1-phosphate uridylyltransferase [Eubacterium sp.]
MKDICTLIFELVSYGKNKGLIDTADEVYTTNKLLELFQIDEYKLDNSSDTQNVNQQDDNNQNVRELHFILEDMMDYAIENGIMENDTITYRDLFDTKIMGLITPPPSVVRAKFNELLNGDSGSNSAGEKKENAKKTTEFYYDFSKATNYIRADRIAKDEKWITSTEFGDLDITINLSKPEKDPRDIAAAGKAKKSGYPACLLCMENEGYAGHFSHPARQNHRIIPITLDGEEYFLQYSPYVYYNEHCIIFNKKHIPMKINKSTMKKLLSFVEKFPHYTAGSNADLPIVGGSILSHDHFQGGGYEFPMVRAPYEKEFSVNGYDDVKAGIIKWPMSTIRLQGDDINRIVELADHILGSWRKYTDKDAFIFAETDGEPHNTITPIARIRQARNPNNKFDASKDVFELDLVLRNNITTDENPLGVYHPHAEYHHIKKENIGLIEVMGLAVLPARLKKEMASLQEAILNGTNLYSDVSLVSHIEWAMNLLPKYGYEVKTDNSTTAIVTKLPEGSKEEIAISLHNIIKDEIGFVFAEVLEDAGVYKRTTEGELAFMRFVDSL